MTKTLEIRQVPEGKYGAGKWEIVRNGVVEMSLHETKQFAINNAFPFYAFPGAYPIEYVTPDTTILCARCARKAYTEEDDPDHAFARDGKIEGYIVEESQHSTGLMCDACDYWIIEPHCIECSDDYTSLARQGRVLVFGNEEGDKCVCERCLAKEKIEGHAIKTGKGTYRVGAQPWWGPGTFSVHTVLRFATEEKLARGTL